ncbi:substrate-binding domain-containing protein [Sinanaerobacter chloroacetimidivorans]|uniref:Substrate-binding domain-containing protein n=1 Tax=Sinanaerobacter chloroacetimidivorans TaxID=2818044 RepID=A0A8J7VZX6_9FIRM|nr:substrate-binding domain-containing protein [Sinanaerobacter chloroacetimidivorans]MBR0598214.1 substrate-binding domain-containing protein [Sinanaerobacter chloroacetimidivorans]
MYGVKRVLKMVWLLVFSVSLLAACSGYQENETDVSPPEDDKIVIGFSMDTLVHERWLRDRDIFVAKANELGAEVILQIAYSDSEEQEKQVQYLLDQDIDVLVLVPHDAVSAAGMVKKAKDRGVKVISYDRLVKNANVDLYISFDNIMVGQLMGEAAVSQTPQGNYLLLNGSQSDNNSSMFREGYLNVIDKGIQDGTINLVAETWVKDWLYENALSYMEETMDSGTKIDAIIAGNDTLASAAVHVLAEKRLAGKVTVVGHDADLDGCQRVVEGTQYATIYKPIDIIATKGAEFAVTLAKGGLVQTNTTISDGRYEIPFYKIDPILVTKPNMMDTIIKDQFHRMEDVYMNVPKTQWP